ncbi:MAG: hypothetical protein K2Q34_04675 [Alphaproteobacteria bacterium]|nr:hypothetical protein [Alphaproteobacteria bacterium]
MATSFEDEDVNAQSLRMHALFKRCKKAFVAFVPTLKDNPSALDEFVNENLRILAGEDQNDIIRGLINCFIPIFNSPGELESNPWYQSCKPFLIDFSAHSNPLIRQSTLVVRAYLLEKSAAYQASKVGMFEATEGLLNEVKSSDYPYFKYLAYQALAEVAKNSGDLDGMVLVVEEGSVAIPPPFNLKLHKYMAGIDLHDIETELKYAPKRIASMQTLIDHGTPKQRIKARFAFANYLWDARLAETELYNKKKALEIYYDLVKDVEELRKIGFEPAKVYVKIAMIRAFGPLQNNEESERLYSHVLEQRATLPSEIYEEALNGFIEFLAYNGNPGNQKRAWELALKSREDTRLSELARTNIQRSLDHLHQYGPEGIKNHSQALQGLNDRLKVKEIDSFDYLECLESLAHLYLHGDETVKNVGEAIERYEYLRGHENYKQRAVDTLLYIYQYVEGYKDLPRAIQYRWELAESLRDEYVKRRVHLKEICSLCARTESLDLEKLKAVTKILVDETGDKKEKLNDYIFLANAYNQYVAQAQASDVLDVNHIILNWPEADDNVIYTSHQRILGIYTQQTEFRFLADTYRRTLGNLKGDEEKRRTYVDFYYFLTNHPDLSTPEEIEQLRVLGRV